MKFDIMNLEPPAKLQGVVEEWRTETVRSTPEQRRIIMHVLKEDEAKHQARWRRYGRNHRQEGDVWVKEEDEIRYALEVAGFEELLAMMADGETVAITKYDHWRDGVYNLEFGHECEKGAAEKGE